MENTQETVVSENAPKLLEPVTIKLYYPVKFGETETISELTLRRPKGKDMKDIPGKPAVGDMMKLAARLCGQPPIVIDQLEMPDFNRVVEVVGNFLDSGQKTGETV